MLYGCSLGIWQSPEITMGFTYTTSQIVPKLEVPERERTWKNNTPVVRAEEETPAAGAQAGWQDAQRQRNWQWGLTAQVVGKEEGEVVEVVVADVEVLSSRCNQTAVETVVQQWTGTWWHEGQNHQLMAGGQDSYGWTERQGYPVEKKLAISQPFIHGPNLPMQSATIHPHPTPHIPLSISSLRE